MSTQMSKDPFTDMPFDGILGLAPSRGGKRPTVLESAIRSDGVGHEVFAMCLAEWGGRLTIGGLSV